MYKVPINDQYRWSSNSSTRFDQKVFEDICGKGLLI